MSITSMSLVWELSASWSSLQEISHVTIARPAFLKRCTKATVSELPGGSSFKKVSRVTVSPSTFNETEAGWIGKAQGGPRQVHLQLQAQVQRRLAFRGDVRWRHCGHHDLQVVQERDPKRDREVGGGWRPRDAAATRNVQGRRRQGAPWDIVGRRPSPSPPY